MVSRSLQDSINCYSTTFEVSTCETCTGVSACGWKIAPVCPAWILHHCSRSLRGHLKMDEYGIHTQLYRNLRWGVCCSVAGLRFQKWLHITPVRQSLLWMFTNWFLSIGFISAANWHIFLPDSSSSDGANRASEFDSPVQTAAGAQCADKHFDLCLARVFLGSILILLRIPGTDTQKALWSSSYAACFNLFQHPSCCFTEKFENLNI